MILTRRSVLFGLLAAPIVVRPGLLMPVKAPRINTDVPFGLIPVRRSITLPEGPIPWIISGYDVQGNYITEMIAPGGASKQMFASVWSCSYPPTLEAIGKPGAITVHGGNIKAVIIE